MASIAVDVTGVTSADGRHWMPEAAFALHEAQIRAVTAPRSLKLGLGHVQNVIGPALRQLRALRPAMTSKGQALDLARIDALPTLLAAFVHCATECVKQTSTPDEWTALHRDAIALRRFLLLQVSAARAVRALRSRPLSPLTMDTGYKNVGGDLMLLVRLIRSEGTGVIRVSEEELTQAEAGAAALLEIHEAHGARDDAFANARRLRRQAYTLLCESYEEASRGVELVLRSRREAARVTPPLHKLSRGRRRARSASTVDDSGDGTPAHAIAQGSQELDVMWILRKKMSAE